MKIGLFGYGKMGKAIERIAEGQGHEIAWRISRENRAAFASEKLREADVAIEFTRPESAFANVMACLEADVPVVCGTTGWAAQLPDAQAFCQKNERSALLWASNFSIGVNLFFALNRSLARLMNARPEYEPSMTEIHHIHKLDAPSGTAITLAEGILAELDRKNSWTLAPETAADALPIEAIREGEVPGTHSVRWQSEVDEITIQHRAFSRDGFAAGAVLAATWLAGRHGFFTMQDVLFSGMRDEG